MMTLGYLLLGATELDGWADFAALLGVEVVEPPGADRLRWRVDDRAWRFEVAKGDRNGLVAAGWQVADEAALAAVAARLNEAGVATEAIAAELCADRLIHDGISCVDPAGVRLEFFIGPRAARTPFASPHGVRFVTGDQGLGHIVLFVAQYEACLDFYRRLLGFRTSDWLRMNGADITFLHCNPRHHSLAIARAESGPRLLHFMLQTETLDEVGYGYDRCAAAGAKLVKTIGLHANDRMVSFYVKTPSGFDVEYGCHGLRIDDPDSWQAGVIPGPSLWGHRPL